MVIAAQPVVDLAFPTRGGPLPADHGYALFGALCRLLPWLHGEAAVGVHPIGGRLEGGRQLALMPGSRLVLRLGTDRIGSALPLAGKRLELDGTTLTVGVPSVRPLRPAATLVSRLVVIRGFMEPTEFLEAVRRQLLTLGVDGEAGLLVRRGDASLEGSGERATGEPVRRTLRVQDKTVVGFGVVVDGLSAEHSLRLQEAGLGGRRRFGCGVFVPAVRR
jgi:CRISPR-associated protein Cas6